MKDPSDTSVVKFLGIGNDQFANDVFESFDAISPFLSPGDSALATTNLTGWEILDLLNNQKDMLKNGDIFIFHYAGHGSFQGDMAPIDEADNDDGIIGLAQSNATDPRTSGGFIDPATDDEIAAIINMIPDSVGVLTIFDSCFAGEMIDGSKDINRGFVIGTSDKNNCAPRKSLFLPFWLNAFSPNGMGSVNADANNDTVLSLGELFEFLNDIDGMDNGIGGVAFAADFESSVSPEHLEYKVAHTPIPEPTSTISLLVLGILGASSTLLRKKKQHKSVSEITSDTLLKKSCG
ncbi:MAG: caspase family protein [Okeania sp. SIO3B5]|uniref:caspase family protein n=1 Tax=Okeania sp. SIO3B5 TaxID=2607811 RepID=UPI001400998A|nr:caspase family protein [Okeania sp. SIO3B5]NEO54794.1 caspase family protein [Okeania sp. SIO3B5]